MDQNSQIRKLLERYLSNSCTRAEMEEFLDILKRAQNEPEIKRLLNDYWNEISTETIPESMPPSKDSEVWFDEIYSQALLREDPIADRSRRIPGTDTTGLLSPARRASQWLKVAALLLVAFCLSLFSLFYFTFQQEESVEVVYEQKMAGPGEKIRFGLSDGTQVHLNAGSTLRYPLSFDGSTREIHLEGEAYFIVARDEKRPFLVQTEEVITRVLGTSFNLRSYPDDDEMIVAVVSGRVAVEEDAGDENALNNIAEQIVLEAGQWAGYNLKTGEFTSGSGDITTFTAWNEGKLVYHDKSLGDVAIMLERWYGVDISFENETIKECVVYGEHQNETLTNVLEAIVYAFGIEYRIEGRQVVLTGEGCE